MPLFELDKSEIAALTDVELRELVARLCEAELAGAGVPRGAVRWSGSQTAPDGGLDVEVRCDGVKHTGDFLPTIPVGLQVKKPKMAAGKIQEEMCPDGTLRDVIGDLADESGAYIIVSLDDDCASKPLADRKKAMADAITALSNASQLKLDFYDRGHLANWLRAHPSVQLWTREKLGRPATGWRPHGKWSSTPGGADDALICEESLRINLPGKRTPDLPIVDGLNEVRQLVRNSKKAVRIVGLSGVGKSRFVQALFEEGVGDNPLDASSVIYADLGDTLDPTANDLVSQLSTLDKSVYLVLDNCPPDVHTRLAARIQQADSKIKLITVEYDVADDKPESTDVVRLDVKDGAIAEKLVRRRFPALGQLNASTIADFAGGNARLALALADQVEDSEDLSSFSNQELFARLFRQRQDDDPNLLPAAEVLSLVYSFDTRLSGEASDELAVLAQLSGHTGLQLYQASEILLRRQIAQKRGPWRAVLPHAIANNLARSALGKFPMSLLRQVFEAPGNVRLLISFGKRLGFLHDHEAAQDVVGEWLGPSGLLSNLMLIDENGLQLLTNIAPVNPDAVLSAIERCSNGPDGSKFTSRDNPRFSTIVELLILLAYDDDLFDRSVSLLMKFVASEAFDENYDSVRNKLNTLYQLCLSGTHATPERRERWIRDTLFDTDPHQRLVGVGMLEAALEAHHWSASSTFEFGARPRDYGYLPHDLSDELSWFRLFLQVAREGARSDNAEVKEHCRRIVANQLRSLWRYTDLRSELTELALEFNEEAPWLEGWRATRMIIRYDEAKSESGQDAEIRELSDSLAPNDLISGISAHVIGAGWDHLDEELDTDDEKKWEKARQRAQERARELGRNAATVRDVLSELDISLFSGQGNVSRFFGEGLAEASEDRNDLWAFLTETLSRASQSPRDYGVLAGVIQVINRHDSSEADRLLEEAIDRPELRPVLLRLQEDISLDAQGIERLHRLIDYEDVQVWAFHSIGWGSAWENVPERYVAELLEHLSRREGGGRVAIDALGMRFFGERKNGQTSSSALRLLALRIIEGVLSAAPDKHDPRLDHHLETVLKISFLPDEHPEACTAIVEKLADNIIGSSRGMSELDDAAALIAKRMPRELLSKLKYDTDLRGYRLYRAFRSRHNKPLLGEVAPEDLLSWCVEDDAADRFIFAINAIEVFTGSGEISDQAILLLQNAPDQEAALSAVAQCARPTSWSGNLSDILKARKQGLEALREQQSITSLATLEQHIQSLEKEIASELERERQRDEESEQRFE